MALQINYNSGVYEIKGLLNSQNSVYLENHLNALIAASTGIVLSLEKVTAIDQYAIKSVIALQEQTILMDKSFYIIGKKNKCVSEQFDALHYNDLLL
ncbi:anti-anti-sigma regulatory factor [Flavobacterium sp. 7E]|uniref:STAS domain-containing protein n=1 Tax=Flavobacterium sp. 7E TaxID=2735898 RepID=UPI00156DAD7E|nr:STAS domain-containing protein [Flavobacterium sp. 7E]NRS89073.1 anti-anti-sigma regulatory factor [Flavobacterium sp. 7E]